MLLSQKECTEKRCLRAVDEAIKNIEEEGTTDAKGRKDYNTSEIDNALS